ncbi:xanthine dehydrogenase family protein molybdopterin-binding subunit [Opitutus terrae]|uniref:Aldehyde oxidase and xanthine dehydrogenase molybdopterin binding n=1 Tax=Opitutus terrae (strain DSM 11246 / JCM 15787 / PB90-1) TaxID=452637 RepID=B1ZZK4_OPITP|nr:molybdopterin cofactor-binding domain-containing protein [Opitutus terrae]ACB76407.1 aldehyde oxidase and xanthine dehydrogenase molybdopterin binding [Opitutus terrae PB90-1]
MNAPDSPTHEFHGVPASADLHPLTRRQFLQRFAGGLVVWIVAGDLLKAAESEAARPMRARPSVPTDFNAFLRIGEDGRVTCFTGKIEMGQGPVTSLPQMLAEDLDVPLDSIDIIMGDTELCPFDQGTWGSLTTRSFGPLWRAAATEARGVLRELGAKSLGVSASEVETDQGMVFVRAQPDRRVSYGALTKGRRIERRLAAKPALKAPGEFKLVGKPLRRRDAQDKVTGKTKFTGDLRLPGMLYARILRPPAHGAKLRHVDTSAAAAVAGVVVVHEGDFVAVLHELPDVADEGLDRVQAEFTPSTSSLTDENIFAHLERSTLPEQPVAAGGDLAEGRQGARRTLTTMYLNSYVAHAAMETHTALARIDGDRATVWASTQNPFGAREEIAEVLGFPSEKVRVITPFVGGGFGGKSANLQAVEAARLAKATGRPVQVMWTREEEFFNDTFRPAAVVKVDAGLDDAGRVTFWDYGVRFAGDRGAAHFYSFPHHRTTSVGNFFGPEGVHPFRVGAWRAPGCNTNSFARESHVEQLAALAGVDPVEFRLRHLTDPRMIRVLKAAADKAGWQPAKGPSGRGFGVACGVDSGSYVATIAEVTVDRAQGTIRVKRVVCAQEMGLVINPQGATIQMEGCIMMGLGYALTEEVRFSAGELRDTNFDTYALPLFSWMPQIETVIVPADDSPPQGGGEPAIIVMGGALANAVFDATGARLLQLPMTPARVKATLANASPLV